MGKLTDVIGILTVAALLSACGFGDEIQNSGREQPGTAYAGEEPAKREFFGMDT